MTGHNKRTDTTHQGRGDRTAVEHVPAPYHTDHKLPEPTLCPICGLIFHKGRWQPGEPPLSANRHICPACQRSRDHAPAAELKLAGKFFTEHRKEIMRLIYNTEEKERLQHPLERIMEILDKDNETHITFTGTHIAHSVGKAVQHAYKGELEAPYTDSDSLMRMSWMRAE